MTCSRANWSRKSLARTEQYQQYAGSRPEDGRAEHEMSFFHPVLDEHECLGHGGLTAVVSHADAAAWLSTALPHAHESDEMWKTQTADTPDADQVIRHKTTSELHAAWRRFVESFDPPEKPNRDKRRAWARANGITQARLQELINDRSLTPAYWSKPGAPKKN